MEKIKKLLSNLYVPIGAAVVIMFGFLRRARALVRALGHVPRIGPVRQAARSGADGRGRMARHGREKSEERIAKLAGNEGEMIRTYRNAAGQEVRVSLVCARLQDIFFHTPERCYPAAGFEIQGEPQSKSFEVGNDDRPSSSPPRFSSPSPRARTRFAVIGAGRATAPGWRRRIPS